MKRILAVLYLQLCKLKTAQHQVVVWDDTRSSLLFWYLNWLFYYIIWLVDNLVNCLSHSSNTVTVCRRQPMRWVFICLLVPFVHLFILVSFLSMKMGPQHYLSFVILNCVIITDRQIVQRSSVRITFFSSFTSPFFFSSWKKSLWWSTCA